MKSVNAILAVTVLMLACGCSPAPRPDEHHVTEPEPATSVDRDTATQNRINSFMYAGAVPKVKDCWAGVQGKGDIEFKYTYRASGTNWVWYQTEVEKSSVDKNQEAAALRCMEEAVRNSSFPMEAAEAARKANEFVIHWTWPVPFPSDVTALGLMISTGGGGGGCKEKSCVNCNCPFKPGPGVVCSCDASCSGYNPPCTLDPDKKGCSMKLPACASGAMGGFGGGVVIARANE